MNYRTILSGKVIHYFKTFVNGFNKISVVNNLPDNLKISESKLSGRVFFGDDCMVVGSDLNGNISFGKKCRVKQVKVLGNLTVGDYSSLWGPNLDVHSKGSLVTVGKFCSIARNVSMQTYNHNYNKITTYYIGKNIFNEEWNNETVQKGEINIGNDVWIGAHSVILGGVTVGHGSVIAANSVVNEDVPPYAIVGGTPAKIIKYRFSEEIIEHLIALEWWNWSDDKINRNKGIFETELSLEAVRNIRC